MIGNMKTLDIFHYCHSGKNQKKDGTKLNIKIKKENFVSLVFFLVSLC